MKPALSTLRCLLGITWLCVSLFSYSQQRDIQSLTKSLTLNHSPVELIDLKTELAFAYYSRDLDSMRRYAYEALTEAKSLDYTRGVSNAYLTVGWSYDMLAMYDSADMYYDSALTAVQNISDAALESRILSSKGVVNESLGNFSEAISFYLMAIEVSESAHDSLAAYSPAYNNLGKVYIDLGDYESSLRYLLFAQEQALRIGDSTSLMPININLGEVKFHLGNLDEAEGHFNLVTELSQNFGDVLRQATAMAHLGLIDLTSGSFDSGLQKMIDSRNMFADANHRKGVAELEFRVGEAYLQGKYYDSALVYLERTVAYKMEFNDQQRLPMIYRNMALAHKALGQEKVAWTYLQRSVDKARELGSLVEMVDALEVLHEWEWSAGKTRDAYQTLTLLLQYQDSVLNEQKVKEIERLQITHRVEQIQREREKIEQEAQFREIQHAAQVDAKNVQIRGFVIVFVFSMLLLGGIYYGYRQKQNDNKLLMDQNDVISRQKSQLRQRKVELEKLMSFKEQSTHMIAHDMKNSLNTIIGLSSIEKHETSEAINQAGKNLLLLITNMLEVQKFEEAKVVLRPEKIPVKVMLEDAFRSVKFIAEQKELKINCNCPEDSFIRVDRQLMQRVIQNLLSNSVNYSRIGGEIDLECQLQEKKTIITVRDHGIGIEPSNIDKVFDKFWNQQSDSGLSISTGLGLNFVKQAVEAHQGKVTVKSKPDIETVFTIELPKTTTAKHVSPEPQTV